MAQASKSIFLSLCFCIIISGLTSGLLWTNSLVIPSNQENWIDVSSPDEQGLDSSKIDQIIVWIRKNNFAIDSLAIIKDDKLVVEEYISLNENILQLQSHSDTKHQIASCTKSITSALIGIAIDKGYINSVKDTVLDFFPDYIDSIGIVDARKQSMTIEDLLTMRTGLDWWQPGSLSPDHSDPGNNGKQMWNSPDFIEYTLSQPMVNNPGEVFAYCGGASHLLSAIIERQTGLSTLEFAQENLFGPIGITDIYWPRASEGTYVGNGGVRLTTVDMAKFGYLFLNNGYWKGKQIISSEWVNNSTKTHHSFNSYNGYGYQWWTSPETGYYYALGAYCQRIIILPEQNMVVVFTANIPTYPDPEMALLQHIVSAIDDKETYSKFNFTMNYSPGMVLDERSDISGSVTNTSGQLDINSNMWPLLKYTVVWESSTSEPSLISNINDYIMNFKSRNPLIEYSSLGDIFTTTKDTHELAYQEFKLIEKGTPLWGVISSWYCEETSRSFIFLYYNLDVDLLPNFEEYIDSFNCH